MTSPVQLSLYEAEAHAALERATGHARALAGALDEVGNALRSAGLDDHHRALAKLIELHRLAAVRVEALARRVGAGPDLESS